MHRKILVLLAATVALSSPTNAKYKEAYKAKSLIDSLAFKLHLNLQSLQGKHQKAIQTQKTSHQQMEVVGNELQLVKKLQSLMNQLALGKRGSLGVPCDGHFSIVDFLGKRPIRIETKSALPVGYTASFTVNHRALVDSGLAQSNGNDLRVYYQERLDKEPVQIDRAVSGLGTTSATISFMLQQPITSSQVDNDSYALVFGSNTAGQAHGNLEKVYAFHDDFSDNNLDRKWTRNWGKWSIKKGAVYGESGSTGRGGEVGIYVKNGSEWKDVEVELDMMETATGDEYPGPFLRTQNPSISGTTGWWFEYWTNKARCTMRPYQNNQDGNWKYKTNLPKPLHINTWFHFKYQVIGNTFSQWANGKLIQDKIQVEKAWMIPKGTLGLGCHKNTVGCRTYYDNIKVRFLVPYSPCVALGDICKLHHDSAQLLGRKKLPADSCKQIHDASVFGGTPRVKNGVYWIKTDLPGNKAVETFCDMGNGGWTLIGKISGSVGNIYDQWLIKNRNLAMLKSPRLTSSNKVACMDARVLATEHASDIMFSSGDNAGGIGSKWVRWELPQGRDVNTFWRNSVGYRAVKATAQVPVKVLRWSGDVETCYQNKYGISPMPVFGGAYPSVSYNTAGNTRGNDNCMGVGVLLPGASTHGWTQNGNGFDNPASNTDWPNSAYTKVTNYLTVWLK